MKSQKGLIGWVVLGILALCLITGGFLVIFSHDSLPGDWVYPIKEITENLKLAVNELSFEGRADVYLDMSEERSSELNQLVKGRNKEKEIIETLDRLKEQQDRALNNLERARSKGVNVTNLLNKLEANLQKQQTIFPELSYQVVGSASEALQKALSNSGETLSKVENLKINQR